MSADVVRGHGDQVGVGGDRQVVVDGHVESEAGLHGARGGSRDGEVERGTAGVAAVDPEHLADHAKFERRDAGDGEQNDLLEHETSVGRVKPIDGNPATRGGNAQSVVLLPC